MNLKHRLISVIVAATAIAASPTMLHAVEVATDTIAAPQQSKRSSTLWIKQLWDNGFHINDPDVDYPAFPRFCRDVYNWGDRVFNSYDPEYVVATGRNWKVQGKSLNWLESYAFIFSRHQDMLMRSDIYADIGAYVSFMAVSLGYMFNANELVGDRNDTRSHINFNFTCSRFNIDVLKTSLKGGATIIKLDGYENGRLVHIPFNGLRSNTINLQGTYFFNNRHYSHAAAYCYSKYQLRSAGSWMAGFQLTRQHTSLDFTELPENIKQIIPLEDHSMIFHFADYALTAGYGYNWALKPRTWLLNLTYLQGVGYKHTHEDNADGRHDMVAVNPQLTIGAVYNHRALFVAFNGRFAGNCYFNSNYTFFNAISTLQLAVGARF